MSLITRCPACETMFKVVPDQLRVSEGWVRCGQCSEIFDATQHMQPSPDGPAEAPVQTATAPRAPQLPVRTSAPAPLAAAAPDARAADSENPETDPQTVFLDQAPDIASAGATAVAEPAADTLPASAAAWPDLRAAALERDTRPPDEPAAQVSFLRGQDKPSIWRRPALRWTLAVALVILLALLALQMVRMERDRIATLAPATRTALETLCALTGCVVSPLRQIESLVIDSSSFSRERGDDYRLGFSLRNTAAIDIALPAIELALTDTQDQPVIRKVITAPQYAPGVASLARASVWTGSLALSVRQGAGSERIAGYRLLAFYP